MDDDEVLAELRKIRAAVNFLAGIVAAVVLLTGIALASSLA